MTVSTLIGLTGKAGSGKNTVADIICDLVPGAEQYALAGPLKQMALAIDPLISQDLDYFLGEFQTVDTRLSTLVRCSGWDEAKRYPEVRRFLQRLGTEGVRGSFGDYAWVDLAEAWWCCSPAQVGVITDVRFPNELELVDVSVKVVRDVETLSVENAQHASEQDLITDYALWNGGTLAELHTQVLNLLTQLGIPVEAGDGFSAL